MLRQYAAGVLSRKRAMDALGLDWYGDLLVRMHARGVSMAPLPAEVQAQMRDSVAKVFAEWRLL